MNVTAIRGSIPTKRVWVENTGDNSDSAVIAFAMKAAGETTSSLYGWNVTRSVAGNAMVQLYTD